MAKGNVNSNFENLKAEMLKKKEVAATKTKNKDDNEFTNTRGTENVNNNVSEIEDVNVDKDVIDYDEVDNDSMVDKTINQSGTNISQNKIIIKKSKKPQPPKRITYYLNQDTIKKIDKYSKLTGMGKSELVQTLLDVALNNLEIE